MNSSRDTKRRVHTTHAWTPTPECSAADATADVRRCTTRRAVAVRARLAGVVLVLLSAVPASGQGAAGPAAGPSVLAAPLGDSTGAQLLIGSVAEDRRRLRDLFSTRPRDDLLLRSLSATGLRADTAGATLRRWSVRPLSPSGAVVWNGAIPFGGNDGQLWAGRGASVIARAGATIERPGVRIVLLPEVTYAQNVAFAFLPNLITPRTSYASRWWNGPNFSADLPQRFGNRPYALVSLGQSSITATVRGTAFGVATENEWWGPGIQNAILLSNNAPGFPHAFVRPARPVVTRFGVIDARYELGLLVPSTFFDTSGVHEYRAFTAFAITLRPAFAPNLSVGVERSVVAPVGTDRGAVLQTAFDPFLKWHSERASHPDGDALLSTFFRYRLPDAHAEVYGEWAKNVVPVSVREFLADPRDGQGFTVGLQAACPIEFAARLLRVQLEATNLEQSISFRDRPTPRPFYTGLSTAGGYTNRGEVLGAWIGPGSSSQYIALDLFDVADNPRTQLGVYAGRVRWNNDALYNQLAPTYNRHDVTLYIGVRGTRRQAWGDIEASVNGSNRLNYQFQNGYAAPGNHLTADVSNTNIRFAITPR